MSGITPLPTPPSTSDPSNFSTRADDFLAALPTFVTEANDLAAALNNISTTSTSVTSNIIGTGSKAFTVETGKSYFPGQSVTVARTAAPENRMFARVDSYDSGTGALVVTSQAFEGSGTFTDWTITLGFNGLIQSGQIAQGAASGLALGDKIQPITASVGSNALTITLNPTTLDFRDATLTSGAVNTRVIPSAISVVVSSGSTLGTINAVQNRLAVLAIDNAGTVELAVVNQAGGVNLNETGVISTTAEGGAGAADSATVIYSTTARTNVPYRVVGFVESTQATAGTWAIAPSTIRGAGGLADIPIVMNAAGSAPMFACRAWVNFNGTGTVAILNSGNVSSITDNGTGLYTINFTTAMPNTNYCVAGMVANNGGNNSLGERADASRTIGGVSVGSWTTSNTAFDSSRVSVAIFI